jgi:hypothetical protein
MNKVIWKPQPRQQRALSCPADIIFYGGAAGGGKSDWLLADFCKQLKYGPDHRGIIFRRSMPELEELISRAHELYGSMGATWSEQKKKYTFQTGSEIKFRFLDSDLDVKKYIGHQYTWIGWDELTNWPSDYPFIFMISRARSAKGVPTWIRAAGNPGGAGQAWVKHMFIDNKIPEKIYTILETDVEMPDTGEIIKVKKTSTFIPAKLSDNYELMRKDPGYQANLMMQPEHIRRALLDGDWSVFGGQIFEEFRYDQHVIKPFSLDPSWTRLAAMDWGYSKPFSIQWFAITGDGRVIMYREWYGCEEGKANVGVKLSASEVANKAWEMSIGEGCDRMIADPACWSKMGTTDNFGNVAPSIAETFERSGWRMEKGINDRLNGLMRCHDLMKTTGHDSRPMFLVFNTCHHFIRTVPALTADPRKPEDVNTAAEDHSYDSFRYLVMHLDTLTPHMGFKEYVPEDQESNENEYDILTHGIG